MILYGIYTAMTLLQIILLVVGKMPVFDAFCISFGAAGTGGFGIKNDSMAGYAPHLQVIVTVFMILFGVNFNIYYLILCRKFRQAFRSEELKAYLGIIGASIPDHDLEHPQLFSHSGRGAASRGLSGGIHHHHHRICHDRF